MDQNAGSFFIDAFRILNPARESYPWQKKLFSDLIRNEWPHIVPLPTGSGKTTVLQIWLLALAWTLRAKTGWVPRRLVWVVDRRVVVDQVSDEAEQVQERLAELPELRAILANASFSNNPLAIGTLRGQYADDREWAADPSTPAVIVGTVDMIGSRLLFRGYRSGPYHRPVDAGLFAVDSLIVNDESHLSPAFAKLLAAIHARRPAAGLEGKQSRILLLSATAEQNQQMRRFEHDPEEDVRENKHFADIFGAPKTLRLTPLEGKAFDSTVFQIATSNPAPRTLIFIESPEKASDFADRLSKAGYTTELLTGTMRGLERDELVERENFKKFLKEKPPEQPVFLVATSAAEVGANLTCERLITDLLEADHMIQRFGRLNRFGGPPGEAFVAFAPPKEQRKQESLKYLESLAGDLSCRNLWNNPAPPDACSEKPMTARLEDRLIETWALTSYKDRFVPRVEAWLRGKYEKEQDPPETELVWRADVADLTADGVDPSDIEKVFDQYPLRPHERLREPSYRVFQKLRGFAEKREEAWGKKLIRIASDGSVDAVTLEGLKDAEGIYRCTLVLPDRFGVLRRGMFRDELPAEDTPSLDVADLDNERERWRIEGDVWTRIGSNAPPIERGESPAAYAAEHGFRAPLKITAADSEKSILYFSKRSNKAQKPDNVPLDQHLSAVAQTARKIAESAGLAQFADQFERAGMLHDKGKHRPMWQRAFGGDMEQPIAKAKTAVNTRLLNGYRHELGSLVDAGADDDLVLHFVASHHAGARPYFEDMQLDRENVRKSQEAALESARRFARLQKRFGPWGLAYLEAVFKSADAMVSRKEGEGASE